MERQTTLVGQTIKLVIALSLNSMSQEDMLSIMLLILILGILNSILHETLTTEMEKVISLF